MAHSRLAETSFCNATESISAPQIGADFLSQNEEAAAQRADRLREVSPDELPTVLEISNDFGVLLQGYKNNKYRMGIALEYAEHLKDRFEPEKYSLDNLEYASEQILPRLYLDSFVLTARRQSYHSLVKQVGARHSPETLFSLQNLIGAKIDLQKEIAEYVALNPDKDSPTIFGNLAQIMHHGRRVLYGDEVTDERAKQENLSQLSAILAEYKVLSALQKRWPLATFGSIEQDQKGTDIVIPDKSNAQKAVALQVKSSRNAEWDLKIKFKNRLVPIVKVPMNIALHDPLQLSREHSNILRTFVSTAAPQPLAAAA